MYLWLTIFIAIGIIMPLAVKLYTKELSITELAISSIGSVFIGAGVIYLGSYLETDDIELLNGSVISKYRETVPCSHSYSCNCRTHKNTTTCDTCYEHPYDYNWVVKTSVGTINIDRVDRQGSIEPLRFKLVEINEPATLEHHFVNYIKAAPNSLFNDQILKDEKIVIPEYPKVFDYYRINRVVLDGVNTDSQLLNNLLNKHLITLGPDKQSNIIVVLTNKTVDESEQYNIKWLGGKQNDTVIILGIKDNTIQYVKTFGFSKNEMSNVSIKSDIEQMENKVLMPETFEAIVNIIDKDIRQYFVRKNMPDYAYLKYEIEPPLWSIIIGLLVSFLLLPVTLIYFTRKGVNIG